LSLQEHLDGTREMSKTQVQAAKILLDKSVSNAPTEIISDISGELSITTINRVIIDPSHDTDTKSL